MNLKIVLQIFAVVLGLYGLCCIIFPQEVFRFFGYEPNHIVGLCNRDYGTSYVSWAVLAWVLGGMDSVMLQKKVALVHTLAMLLSGSVTLYGALTNDPSYPGVIFNYIGVSMYYIFMIPFGIIWWRLSVEIKKERAIAADAFARAEQKGLNPDILNDK